MNENNLVYELENKVYINLTNSCSNNCVFCIRSIKEDVVGTNLFLTSENVEAQDVIEQLDKFKNKLGDEVVFCGYGEPLIKLRTLETVAKYIRKKYPKVKIRVNTNGQASLIHKKDIPKELANYIDKVSVSLNAEDEKRYIILSKPAYDDSYEAVKKFIADCVKYGIDTTATVVTGYKSYKVDVEKCKEITKSLGAKFRERPWLDNGY